MGEVEDDSVQLIVTSPPYNVGKPYQGHDDTMPLEEYLVFLREVWQECWRVLCRGGRMAINVANTNRQPYLPLSAYVAHQMTRELNFLMRGEIIWDKGASVGVSTAWGSFARASNPVLRDVHEYILVFCKQSYRLEGTRGQQSGIENQDFVEWTRSVWQLSLEGTREPAKMSGHLDLKDLGQSIWRFPAKSASRVPHPAPFPEELPARLILLYTNEGDVVLDPFMGSGTTAVAAKRLKRHYIGYDISEDYCRLARQRLALVEAGKY